MRPLIYDNINDFEEDVRRWLLAESWPTRQEGRKRVGRTRLDTLGLGIDCSDSLLYKGITGHARRSIPLFANPETNLRRNKLVLLTKSANTHYLEGLPAGAVAVTFSLNPEREADLRRKNYASYTRVRAPGGELYAKADPKARSWSVA